MPVAQSPHPVTHVMRLVVWLGCEDVVHYRQARTMVLPFPEQAALCTNTWWYQPASSCSEWNVPSYGVSKRKIK